MNTISFLHYKKENLNQNKSECNIQKIKSKYIIQIIFNNLKKIKTLEIVRYIKIKKTKINLNNKIIKNIKIY